MMEASKKSGSMHPPPDPPAARLSCNRMLVIPPPHSQIRTPPKSQPSDRHDEHKIDITIGHGSIVNIG